VYAYSEEAYGQIHVVTRSPNRYCWIAVLQAGEDMVMTQTDFKTLRRGVKQASVLECERLFEVVHCHWGILHRMSAFHDFCSEWPYTFCVFHNKLLAQKTVVISFLTTFVKNVSACLVNGCESTDFTAVFNIQTWHSYYATEEFIAIFLALLHNVILCVQCALTGIFGIDLAQTLW
jgi:hypothetical protein